MILESKNWQHFKYFSKDPLKIIEKIEGDVTLADVPISYLSPTQSYNEFLAKKEKRVKSMLQEDGINFLKKWPIIVCALPSTISDFDYNQNPESLFSLLILDGHHRKRFAPKYGIHRIPTIILSLSQTALAYEVNDLGRMADILASWQSEAFQSAALLGVNLPQPKFFNFARNQRGLSPNFI